MKYDNFGIVNYKSLVNIKMSIFIFFTENREKTFLLSIIFFPKNITAQS